MVWNGDIENLRKAVQQSPDNIALRQYFADLLLKSGYIDEAEKEYRAALQIDPVNEQLKLGLASTFFRQGKVSASLVVVEDLLKSAKPSPRAFLLRARILLASGDRKQAAQDYESAIDVDPSLQDPELSERLGVKKEPEEIDEDTDRLRLPVEESVVYTPPSVEKPVISFKDVGGMESLKEEIRMKIIYPITNPEMFKAYGKQVGGGIMMYGPPGCGKTYLARATAGEVRAGFLAVGINDILDMWIGQSERNLHELFEHARSNRPCVLFFDEVDALGASRSDMRQSAGRHLINQFLMELDGLQSSNEGVLILAATNAPWHLDQAFRRPGRFDRIIFVPPPDATARASILRILTRGKPIEDVDYDHVGRKADNFSGADLKAILDIAVENKLKEAMKAGVKRPITTKDLIDAIKLVKPTTKEWFSTARNYALYSNQGGLYDDVLKYLKL